ncbi:MAG TPA: hypothetical protein VMV56_07570 [Williamwhitmania sp.]|nr:hypothetical protein [Williamwhitmania sp.]
MTFVYGATTITFTGALWPFENEIGRHQNFGIAADGTLRVYDRGYDEEFIRLEIMSGHANLTGLRAFIKTTIKFMKTSFTFTPDTNIDVGNGDGGAVTVNLWQTNLIEKQEAYHRYRYFITLRVAP